MNVKIILIVVFSLLIFQFVFYKMQDEKKVEKIAIEEFEKESPLISKKQMKFLSFIKRLDEELMHLRDDENFREFVKNDTKKEFVEKHFIHILEQLPELFQLRYINNDGFEIIKARFENNMIYLIPKNKLQDKSHRYYYKEIMQLDETKMWLSKIDFNMENGVIEEPKKLTLRVGIPVFVEGFKDGFIIANISMDNFDIQDGEFLQSFRNNTEKNIFISF